MLATRSMQEEAESDTTNLHKSREIRFRAPGVLGRVRDAGGGSKRAPGRSWDGLGALLGCAQRECLQNHHIGLQNCTWEPPGPENRKALGN